MTGVKLVGYEAGILVGVINRRKWQFDFHVIGKSVTSAILIDGEYAPH